MSDFLLFRQYFVNISVLTSPRREAEKIIGEKKGLGEISVSISTVRLSRPDFISGTRVLGACFRGQEPQAQKRPPPTRSQKKKKQTSFRATTGAASRVRPPPPSLSALRRSPSRARPRQRLGGRDRLRSSPKMMN